MYYVHCISGENEKRWRQVKSTYVAWRVESFLAGLQSSWLCDELPSYSGMSWRWHRQPRYTSPFGESCCKPEAQCTLVKWLGNGDDQRHSLFTTFLEGSVLLLSCVCWWRSYWGTPEQWARGCCHDSHVTKGALSASSRPVMTGGHTWSHNHHLWENATGE